MDKGWKRPDSVPLPSVWKRYEGPRAMPDGRRPNFWIQDVTPDLDDAVVNFMSDNFLKEEILCSLSGILEDPLSLNEIRMIWKKLLQQRAALVALTDWPDGPDHPRIAGCNITYVNVRGQQVREGGSGAALKKVMSAMQHAEKSVDAFKEFGVDAFLDALGLSVDPLFRGQELGQQLLLARDPLCRALGLSLTLTVFTSSAAQKVSERAGFKVIAEKRYDEYRNEEGELVFPNVPVATFQLKVKHIA